MQLYATGKESSRYIEVLLSATNILRLFLVHNKLRLNDIHVLTGLQKNRVMRICGTLIKSNFVCFNPETKEYSLGPMVSLLGKQYERYSSRNANIRDTLCRLSKLTGETTTFCIVSGNQRMYEALQEGDKAMRFSVDEGTTTPIYAGAGGKALLAFMDSDHAEQIINELEFSSLTPLTVQSCDVLREQLRQIRLDGFAVSFGENVPSAAGLAAPVFGVHNTLEGIINIAGLADDFSNERYKRFIPALFESCAHLSALLGCVESYNIVLSACNQ